MPNRILRDWTDSKPMNSLNWQEEVLFTRLIMKADDYGNFYADSILIKSLLFPRKDGLRVTDIDRWLKNLITAGLIRTYTAKGESFLSIVNFGQRLRNTRRVFPEPAESFDESPPQVAADGSEPPPETKRNETESETETNYRAFAHLKLSLVEFEDLIQLGYSKEKIDEILDSIENYAKNKNYKNLFLTAKNWLKTDKEKSSAKKESGSQLQKHQDNFKKASDLLNGNPTS